MLKKNSPKQNKLNNQDLNNSVQYFLKKEELLVFNKTKDSKKIKTTLQSNNSSRYFYFDTKLNERTVFEDLLINYLLENGYNITTNKKIASYYIGYNDSTFKACTKKKYQKAVSLSTMFYPALTYGLDDNELEYMPLKKKLLNSLKNSQLNDIDLIKTQILIIHGKSESHHPWLQAAFLYSSLKDRHQDDKSKMILVPDIDEYLYQKPNKKLQAFLNKTILAFFNDEK